jgi:hypothetical protein
VENLAAAEQDAQAISQATNEPRTPLWRQARAGGIYGVLAGIPSGYFEDGTFVRFRELSVTYALPATVGRFMHVHSMSLTGAVRNLALWTRYSGGDPEVSDPGDTRQPLGGGAASVNNDVRVQNLGSVPLARYWVARLNIGV